MRFELAQSANEYYLFYFNFKEKVNIINAFYDLNGSRSISAASNLLNTNKNSLKVLFGPY